MFRKVHLVGLFCLLSFHVMGQRINSITIATNGWANNSVNTVIFRKNSLVTHKNIQYASYYDEEQFVVLAKRKINSKKWETLRTPYQGDAEDAHKSISIMVDGDGYLHIAWGQHNNNLNYAKSLNPEDLVLGSKMQMLGLKENKVSYPEFYQLANGDILFSYRDGGSGNGNLMINRYSCKTKTWSQLQNNLIDGEGQRNAYVQTTIDEKGTIHLSWVWRESPDVASNHDLCYAKSTDGGLTWEKSTGEKYQLPINATNAEYALKIPQNSELINQTSMATDFSGNPYIVSYWVKQGDSIPQYQVVYKNGLTWEVKSLSFRKMDFTLSGGGTKKIPISRPQIVVWKNKKNIAAAIIFRDIERANKVSIAINKNMAINFWECKDLTNYSVGEWEPSYDTALWQHKKRLALFVQNVTQIDGEGKANHQPTKVEVLTIKGL